VDLSDECIRRWRVDAPVNVQTAVVVTDSPFGAFVTVRRCVNPMKAPNWWQTNRWPRLRLALKRREPIDYKREDFVARVRELTKGRGVDSVFDPIGGKHLSRSWAALARPGTLVCYGVSEALSEPGARKKALLATLTRLAWFALPFGTRRASSYGISSGKHSTPALIREDLGRLLDLLRQKKLHPVIGARFPLAKARQAHELIDHSGTTGKVVLDHFGSTWIGS
jgi:NADPH:quinone reductase-like Zn-dependent oxidoreductase